MQLIRWKAWLALASCIFIIYLSLPTILPSSLVRSWMIGSPIILGLDLRGGVSLLLEVSSDKYIEEQMASIVDRVQKEGIKAKFGEPKDDTANLIIQSRDEDKIRSIIEKVFDKDGYILKAHDEQIDIRITEKFMQDMRLRLVAQSIDILHKRLDESGTKEIDIQRQGEERILIQVPGVYDTEEIKRLLGKTSRLTLHLVNTEVTQKDLEKRKMPMGTKPVSFEGANTFLPLYITPVITGDMLIDAQSTMQLGTYGVQFRLNNAGAKRFAEVTSKNVGKPLAIVLDDKVISAPMIKEAMISGSGIISGNFNAKSAAELAILLRSGALPTQLKVIEERTVGPSLGQASIEAGTTAVIAGACVVIVFMFLFYGIGGLFANVGMIMNIIMILACLQLLGATLTMPGIAGIVLTLGMAVDANVLIFERMREERRNGKSVLASLSGGYAMAMTTIIDSNVTTIAAATVLYAFGGGVIKGFAVTLTVGLICSLFTAVTLTKTMMACWYHIVRPKTLNI